ncbi:hypothetical protein [Pseudomonas sp. TMP25]|uniref:hypothetical protein n=1 Tax=Pseudomonas sp. TMP25 TaxID=3136561 RepID=UPI0031010DCC
MKTSDLIEHIKAGTFNCSKIIPDKINSYEILNISDFEVLKGISKYRSGFEFLRKTETWAKNSNRQFILGEMDRLCKFLRSIEASGCRCILYKYSSPAPETEEESGSVKILHKSEDSFVTEYQCVCTACNSVYQVTIEEVRFGHQTRWIKK